MRVGLFLSMIMGAGLVAGCASSGADSGLATVQLQATQINLGQTGMAVLVAKGDSTSVDFTISGVPGGASEPLQLLSFIYPGSCASLAATPAYSMNQDTQVFPGQAGWGMSKTLPVSLATLQASAHAIVVRSSPADGNQNIFCGDIR